MLHKFSEARNAWPWDIERLTWYQLYALLGMRAERIEGGMTNEELQERLRKYGN